ncbi:MAG TPA: orotate phosphoribosyltransferase [Candidatus Cybelea sp.]|nr:orotate phosphoribosyltransferase [Candidatus Cybelea sp.]
MGGNDAKARLKRIIAEKSLIRGDALKLASGATSKYYFDMKPTMFDPEGAGLIADLIIAALAGAKVDLIGGLEMGAVPIVACVAQRSFPARPIAGFFVRKQPKDHGTQRLIEGTPRGMDMRGKHVALLEDVTTTGGSVMKAVNAVRAEGAVVETIITIVDRLEGAAANLAREGLRLVPLITAVEFDL